MPLTVYLILSVVAIRDAALWRLLMVRGRTMLVQAAVALSNSYDNHHTPIAIVISVNGAPSLK